MKEEKSNSHCLTWLIYFHFIDLFSNNAATEDNIFCSVSRVLYASMGLFQFFFSISTVRV